jgi:hypothetical protein
MLVVGESFRTWLPYRDAKAQERLDLRILSIEKMKA